MTIASAAPSPPDEPLMQDAQETLAKGFPWMRFQHGMEQQFVRDGRDERLTHFLISGWLSLAVYNGFLLADYLMATDVFWFALRLRVLYFSPVAVVLLLVAARRNSRLMQALPPWGIEWIVMSSGTAAAATLAIILARSHTPLIYFYHVGLIVVILYGNLVQRLRFWNAVLFSLSVLAIHLIGVVHFTTFPDRLMWPVISLVFASTLFSLTANYTMERDERRRYLLTLLERGVVRELTRAHDKLQELSRVDGLTGLYNRRHFQDYLGQVWERAQYDASAISILMVDVDHFKKYNDRYGHPAGDDCLRRIAAILQANLRRPGDMIARYGGEEFIAVLPQTEQHDAEAIAERIRQSVEALQMPHEAAPPPHRVTVSIGIASCQADFLLKASTVVSVADDALYQAKDEGRNRLCSRNLPPVQTGAQPV
jgi:diguanylate cyclase (GGDEF)-like protein